MNFPSILFDHFQKANFSLKNKIVMAPLTRSRAINNIPNVLMATYYNQRAGAGLIITEGTSPSPNGLGYPRIPGIYSDEQIEGWKKTTEKVHKKGAKIFLQLMHCGRVCHPDNMPAQTRILAPSVVRLKDTKMYVDGKGEQPIPFPEAMSLEDIKDTIEEYRIAASNAMKAGFDGVEIHAANGYLIEQFLNTASNKRDDQYGGRIENRTRFALEVTNAVVKEIGAENVGMRISPYGVMNEMESDPLTYELYTYLAIQVNRLNIAYLHIVDHESMGAPEVPDEIKSTIKSLFNNTIILSGGYDKSKALEDLKSNKADLIAFGRPFISNPDLPTRMAMNAKLNEWDQETFYSSGPKGYTDYPVLHEVQKFTTTIK